MKKILLCSFIVILAMAANSAQAQFNPYSDNAKMFTAGFGISGWGVPIFVRFEAPVADNITVGGVASFQTKTENYTGYKYKNTIFGIGARGSYHFNELLEINDDWDVYAGLGLGYYFWDYKYEGSGTSVPYSGSGSGGFTVGIHAGGRYFINDNFGINLEFGGNTVLGGATIGATFLF